MLTSEQKEKALALISQGAHISPKDFSEYIPLINYRMDSLDILSAMAAIEEEFGVKIKDRDIEKLKTGHDVLNYLEKLV